MDAVAPTTKIRPSGCLKTGVIVLGTMVGLAYVFLYPIFKHAVGMAVASSGVQQAHAIQIVLSDYALEHPDEFAKAKSSTEVFQKLLDEKFVTDATTFYYPLPGKVRTTPDAKKLLPENVGFDITYSNDDHIPGYMPMVFSSGFAVTYHAGAKAVPLRKAHSWQDWWEGAHPPTSIVVDTKDGKGSWWYVDPDGSIPKFLPAEFDPKGKIYRQLTPDGKLGP